MILVHKDTKSPVKKGEVVTDSRGDEAIVTSWQEPKTTASTGRVYVEHSPLGGSFGYYPSVYKLEFVEEV